MILLFFFLHSDKECMKYWYTCLEFIMGWDPSTLVSRGGVYFLRKWATNTNLKCSDAAFPK